MFETRSQSWREVGLLRQITPGAIRRARREGALLLAMFAGVLVVYSLRHRLFGHSSDTPVRIVAIFVLVLLGMGFARDLGRALAPVFFRRMEPATAGTVGFLIRLGTVVGVVFIALWVAGVSPGTIGVAAGTFTAIFSIVFGLAAQQTLGNFFAGTVLLTARPFRVGERVRLQGGMLAGQIEGVVSSLGLLYTTFATGEDSIMVPNSVVLGVAVRPLREPDAVTLRARLAAGMAPADLQESLERSLKTPLRGSPRITLEELDGTQAIVQIVATPQRAADGRDLASELLALVPARHPEGEHPGAGARAAAGEGAAAAEGPAGPDPRGGDGRAADGGGRPRDGQPAPWGGAVR
jgi:small conductance mechanosensitive channel